MDRSRIAVLLAAAAVSLAASLFAVGAAASPDEDDPAATPTTVAPVTRDTAAPAAGPTLDIEIAGFEFGPVDAVVQVGTAVTWTNNDGFDHTVASETGAFPESPTMGEGATYSFTFTEPGTYAYACGIHPQMKGTVVVEG